MNHIMENKALVKYLSYFSIIHIYVLQQTQARKKYRHSEKSIDIQKYT